MNTNAPWYVSSLDMEGNSKPVCVCKSKEEAEATLAKLNDEIPKGVLMWYSAVEGVAADTDFRVNDTVETVAEPISLGEFLNALEAIGMFS